MPFARLMKGENLRKWHAIFQLDEKPTQFWKWPDNEEYWPTCIFYRRYPLCQFFDRDNQFPNCKKEILQTFAKNQFDSRIRNSVTYLNSPLIQLWIFSNFLLFSIFNNPKAEALKCAGTLWYLRGSLVVPTNQSESDIIETTFFPTLIAF